MPLLYYFCTLSQYHLFPCFSFHSDPEAAVPFAEALYGNYEFVSAVYNSLSNNGILVMQLGEAPEFGSPDENNSLFKNRAATTKLMEDLGFGSIHTYEEVSRQHSGVTDCLSIHSNLIFSLTEMVVSLWV